MHRTGLLFAAALLCGLFVGCGGSGSSDEAKDPTVYAFNASPDGGSLNFLLNEVAFASNLGYLGRSTDFSSVEFVSEDDGGYDLAITTAGGDEEFDRRVVNYEEDKHYLTLAVGLRNFAPGEELKRLRVVDFDVMRDAPIGNKSQLLIVHAMMRGPGLETPPITFQNPGMNPQFVASGIDFAAGRSLLVDSGATSWIAKRSDVDGETIYASRDITLDPASIYLVVVVGIEGDANPARQPQLIFQKLTTSD